MRKLMPVSAQSLFFPAGDHFPLVFLLVMAAFSLTCKILLLYSALRE